MLEIRCKELLDTVIIPLKDNILSSEIPPVVQSSLAKLERYCTIFMFEKYCSSEFVI